MIFYATAAVDKVHVYGLLEVFLDRKVSFQIVRVLLSYYIKRQVFVKLDGHCELITINSGVNKEEFSHHNFIICM